MRLRLCMLAIGASLRMLSNTADALMLQREMYRDVFEGLSRDVLVNNPIADDAAARARL